MDLMTAAQLLGNFGEFFGAIAVVATLIYLAGQLRQNTKALRSSSYDAYNNAASQQIAFQGQHSAELAEIMDSATPYKELSTQQRMLLDLFSSGAFNTIEVTYLHHRAGTMDDNVFKGKVAGFRSFMNAPSAIEAWSRLQGQYGADFRNFMRVEVIAKATGAASWASGAPGTGVN